MKKKIFGIAIVALLASAVGCKKFVTQQPLSSGTLDNFFKNQFDADAAMAGMYSSYQQLLIGEGNFKNRLTFWGEARSDNFEQFKQYASNDVIEMHTNGLSANNTFSDWTGLYKVIGRANLNIVKFPDINKYANPANPAEVIDAAKLNRYLAECYAMRAICYFYVVRNWGDAPIRTQPYLSLDSIADLPRSPKEQVLDQIGSDIQKAYDLIPKNATPVVWYIGEGAICAAGAEVAMWRKDYPNAIKWIQRSFAAKAPTGKVFNTKGTAAIGSGGDSTTMETTANWKVQFTNPAASIETMWSLQWNYLANGCACMAGVSTANNNTPLRIATEIFTAWPKDTADVRPKSSFDATKKEQDRFWKWYPGAFATTTQNPLPTPKNNYTGTYGSDMNVYVPMYRLADVYLLYAEALNKTGDMTNSLKYLNLVHVRSGQKAYPATQFTTINAMEDAILNERQRELIGEGKRWYDLIRTDHVKVIMDPILKTRQQALAVDQIGFGDDMRKILWPINRNVLNANRKLTQNPPYSD